jgi:putative heme iron utilization protein
MILLVDKTCKQCQKLEGVEAKYKNVQKFYVTEGVADINGEKVQLAPQISYLPVLIDGKHYYFFVDVILEHLEKSGEMNAKANIL